MKNRTQNILVFVVIGFLFIPLAFQLPGLNEKVQPLNGAFEKTDTLAFSIAAWKDKTWQENRANLQKNNLHIRPSIIRVKHELDYRLFHEFHMSDLLIGKEDYLFSIGWATSRANKHTLNADSIAAFGTKLKKLASVLQQKGKYFKIIIPPAKEEIFHAYLPTELAQENVDNDYHLYIQTLQNNDIDYWDLLPFYQQLMDTCSYPLYSKTSVHWTKYGASFTLLKLLADMESNLQLKMPQLKITKLNISKFANGDGDFETTLNLLNKIDNSDFAYPSYTVDTSNSHVHKPKVLTIGDSFYWGMKGTWMLPQVYTMDSKYLYYYNTVYYNGNQPSQNIKDIDIVAEFKSADAIVLINSPHNLDGFPFGLDSDMDKIIEGLKELPNAE
tara:strand:+ start:10185 stop:11342 length:1158 start_codon:yes stop_codon:yes gene_type:complete